MKKYKYRYFGTILMGFGFGFLIGSSLDEWGWYILFPIALFFLGAFIRFYLKK